MPINDCSQIHKAFFEFDISYVGAPNLIGVFYYNLSSVISKLFKQVWILVMLFIGCSGTQGA